MGNSNDCYTTVSFTEQTANVPCTFATAICVCAHILSIKVTMCIVHYVQVTTDMANN